MTIRPTTHPMHNTQAFSCLWRLASVLSCLGFVSGCTSFPQPPYGCKTQISAGTSLSPTPLQLTLYTTEQPQASKYFMGLAAAGAYHGSFITRHVPHYFITLGEKSWQNLPNAPPIRITQPRPELLEKRSHIGEFALIQNPDGTYGPHVLLRTGTAFQGSTYLPPHLVIGRITQGFDIAEKLTKGDHLTTVQNSSTRCHQP